MGTIPSATQMILNDFGFILVMATFSMYEHSLKSRFSLIHASFSSADRVLASIDWGGEQT